MSSIAPSGFILYDGFPGLPNPNAPIPKNGFDSTDAGNRSTTPLYPPGTKIQAFQDATVGAGGTRVANRGYYTMVYAAVLDYTNAVDASIGKMAQMACGSTKARGNLVVSQDMSGGVGTTAGVGHNPIAVFCTSTVDVSFSTPQYMWLWCGGVCPNYDLTKLDVTGFLTDGNVVAGVPIQIDSDATTVRPSFFCTTHASSYAAFPAGLGLEDDT